MPWPTYAPGYPPCGCSPAAAWSIDGVEWVYSVPRAADWIDSTTGEIVSLFKGIHPVDAAIGHQWRAVFGAGIALGSGGQRFGEIRKVTPKTRIEMIYEARRIFEPFIKRKWARIIEPILCVVDEVNGTGRIQVDYQNLLTARPEKVRGGLSHV